MCTCGTCRVKAEKPFLSHKISFPQIIQVTIVCAFFSYVSFFLNTIQSLLHKSFWHDTEYCLMYETTKNLRFFKFYKYLKVCEITNTKLQILDFFFLKFTCYFLYYDWCLIVHSTILKWYVAVVFGCQQSIV